MWKLYTATNESVCLRSTYSRLRAVLRKEIDISVVHYIDYTRDWSPEGNIFYPFVHKRKSFEHEKELRAIRFEPPPAVGDKVNCRFRKFLPGGFRKFLPVERAGLR